MVSFERHKENPLDSLEIGRIEERRKERYFNEINKSIERSLILFAKYDGVKIQGWDHLHDRNPSIEDPFGGFIIKFSVTSFPFPNAERMHMGEIDIRMNGRASACLYLDPFNKNINQFGSVEECWESLEEWLKEFTKKPEYKIRWI
jgi:hypothetical protein